MRLHMRFRGLAVCAVVRHNEKYYEIKVKIKHVKYSVVGRRCYTCTMKCAVFSEIVLGCRQQLNTVNIVKKT